MKPIVYVALPQFCEKDETPRRRLLEAGCEVRQNSSGRRLKREEIVVAVGDAEAVIAGLEPYDDVILAALPRVRCISSTYDRVPALHGNALCGKSVGFFRRTESSSCIPIGC